MKDEKDGLILIPATRSTMFESAKITFFDDASKHHWWQLFLQNGFSSEEAKMYMNCIDDYAQHAFTIIRRADEYLHPEEYERRIHYGTTSDYS